MGLFLFGKSYRVNSLLCLAIEYKKLRTDWLWNPFTYPPALPAPRNSHTSRAPHREAALHSNYADLLHATDRAESALEHLKQSAALLTQIGGEEGVRRPEIWKLVEW
jgi:hypothetical protein